MGTFLKSFDTVNGFCLTPTVIAVIFPLTIGGSNSSPKLRCDSDVGSSAFPQPTWAQ
jgi:hypothetical protein